MVWSFWACGQCWCGWAVQLWSRQLVPHYWGDTLGLFDVLSWSVFTLACEETVPTLCELWGVFCLLLSGDSFPGPGWPSQMDVLISSQLSLGWGALRCLQFSFRAALSFPSFWPGDSGLLASELPALVFSIKESAGLSGPWAGRHRAYLFFLLSQDYCLVSLLIQCLKTVKSIFPKFLGCLCLGLRTFGQLVKLQWSLWERYLGYFILFLQLDIVSKQKQTGEKIR